MSTVSVDLPTIIGAWSQALPPLIAIGLSTATAIKNLIHAGHPDLTPEQLAQAYAAILADDAVRAAFAEQASHPS